MIGEWRGATSSTNEPGKTRRVIASVVVAFVLGGAAGGVVEHVRVQHSNRHQSATTKSKTAAWFASHQTTSCTELRRWNIEYVAAYRAALTPSPSWPATRLILLQHHHRIAAAYTTLRTVTTPLGRAELTFLSSQEKQTIAALTTATSAPTFLQAERTLASSRLARDTATLSRTLKACPKK